LFNPISSIQDNFWELINDPFEAELSEVIENFKHIIREGF
jgi:hypothetical protein